MCEAALPSRALMILLRHCRVPTLTQAIKAAGAVQTQMAMTRAWQLKASKRSWRAGEDVVLLIEACKVFPELGATAASLLTEAPIAEVGPGIIPQLYAQTWARPVLDHW